MVIERMREGYSEKACFQAVDGCFSSKWHMGDNPNNQIYDRVQTIFRKSESVQRLVDSSQKKSRSALVSSGGNQDPFVMGAMRDQIQRNRNHARWKKKATKKPISRKSIDGILDDLCEEVLGGGEDDLAEEQS